MRYSKAEARRLCRSLNREGRKSDIAEESERAMEVLRGMREWQEAKTVLLFHSLADEPETRGLIEECVKEGKRVVLPSILEDGGWEMRLYDGKTKAGAYGIREAVGSVFTAYNEIDFAVVPGVAFTEKGERVGRGKGYYDRMLGEVRCARAGYCFSWQVLEDVETAGWDEKVDYVATADGVIDCKLKRNKMEIAIIVAVARNGAIGKNGGMPWRQKADLKRFKALTMGHPIVMGRKTFESIGRALPGRRNIVVSSSAEAIEGCEVRRSVEEVMKDETLSGETVFIIGGGTIYRQFMPMADRLYLTRIDAEPDGADTFFGEVDENEWEVVQSESFGADEENEYGYEFVDMVRRIVF